jgi:hypothetical protein
VDVMDVTQNPAVLISTFWFNETTGLALASTPTQANLDVYTEPVVINDGAHASFGAKADAAAGSDTGTFSFISLFKRLLQSTTTMSSRTGDLTESAPGTDTASSGLNGRLQRVAQRLTSLIGVLPSSLGKKTAANSLSVTLSSDEALPAGENHIGAIGGNTEKLAIAITTSSTAYSANDNIGGVITLSNFLRVSGGTGVLQGIQLWALANQKPNLYIDFWDASPGTGTYTNDSAQVIAGDHAAHLGFIEIAAADWKDTGTISRTALTSIGMVLKGNASRNIYMTIQDKTGVTFGSVAGLFAKVSILQD